MNYRRRRQLQSLLLPTESTPNDSFDDQVVCRARHTPARAEVDFPIWGDIEVNGRNKLLLLLRHRIKTADWPQRTVILQPTGHDFGEIIGHFCVRRKFKTPAAIVTVQGFVDSWIEREIPGPNLLINDRTHLPRPGVRRKTMALIANLIRETQAQGPMPFLWNSKAGTYVVSHPVPAVA